MVCPRDEDEVGVVSIDKCVQHMVGDVPHVYKLKSVWCPVHILIVS